MCPNQSDTAGVKIPELDLELACGTLGGIVTTVEGLITKVSESKCNFLTLSMLVLTTHINEQFM